MADTIQYALMSGDVYGSAVPPGWTQIAHSVNDQNSFYAADTQMVLRS